MTDQTKKAIKVTLALVLPLGLGVGIWAVAIRKTKKGTTLWQDWTGKGSAPSIPQKAYVCTTAKVSSGSAPASGGSFPLIMNPNVFNANVKTLQHALNVKGIKANGQSLVEDGYLGTNTAIAITNAGYGLPVSQSDFQAMIS